MINNELDNIIKNFMEEITPYFDFLEKYNNIQNIRLDINKQCDRFLRNLREYFFTKYYSLLLKRYKTINKIYKKHITIFLKYKYPDKSNKFIQKLRTLLIKNYHLFNNNKFFINKKFISITHVSNIYNIGLAIYKSIINNK